MRRRMGRLICNLDKDDREIRRLNLLRTGEGEWEIEEKENATEFEAEGRVKCVREEEGERREYVDGQLGGQRHGERSGGPGRMMREIKDKILG